MATNPEGCRRGELGLTLIEALVVVTLTALLALLLLPLVSRSSQRNLDVAERSLESAAASTAEVEFRGLLGRAMQYHANGVIDRGLEGQPDQVLFVPGLSKSLACARAGGTGQIRLRIYQTTTAGRLVCESSNGRVALLEWTSGRGTFSYSADGTSWSPVWHGDTPSGQASRGGAQAATRDAPLVKFELSLHRARSLTWLVRAGAAEPALIDPSGDARGTVP